MGFLHAMTVRSLSLKPLVVTSVCFFLCWIDLHELRAQRILIPSGGGNEEKLQVYNQFNSLYEDKCDAAKNRIESRLLDIDRVCKLSAKQRTRLEVAGKGAVVAYSGKILEKLELQAKRSGVEFDRSNPPEKEPDEEQEFGGVAGRRLRIIDIGEELKATIDAEQIWVSSVKKTLTDAQLKKLNSWTVAKQKIIRQAAVGYFVAKADLKMFLSGEQVEKLKAHVDKEYGPQLVQQMNVPPKENRNFIAAGMLQQNRDIEVDDALKTILSQSQLEIWKTDFQATLDSL